jgi:hypothetical protein
MSSAPVIPILFGGLMVWSIIRRVRLTRFETTDEGHFYTPNTHIGIGLSVLFAGRIAYRFIVLGDVATAQNPAPPFQSPLTFFIFGLTVGYYIVYQIGLFVHTHDKKPAA